MSSRNVHPFLNTEPHHQTGKCKVVSPREAIRVLRDGDTVATGGFVGIGFPEDIAIALREYYQETHAPKNLTLIYAAGQGDGRDRGLNHLGCEGLVGKVIGGHWGLVPALQQLALENKILAYNFPQGVISHLYRDIGAKRPRTITTVGLGTFVDPRHGGGKLNEKTTEDLVEVLHFDDKEYLAYRTFPINVAILRGTTADENGNVTMEKEALTLESLAIAIAAHNSNGFVIVQVERIAEKGTLNPKQVKIPGIFVDCVVQAQADNHWQTFATPYNPAFSGELRIPMRTLSPMAMSERKIIARRAALELQVNSVVNLGIGMPEGIANVAHEEKILDYITLTAEPGVIGGIPAGGLNFGAATNTEAIIDQPSQFDFYDGGGLDLAFLGLAQCDRHGNLNVSKFGPKLAGAGGFINISQNAKKVVFIGTFTTGGLKISLTNATLHIDAEGTAKKFLADVEHITFSGRYALEKGQDVLYITERCVFRLTSSGMILEEIAPGIDLHRDILAHMDFTPLIAEDLRLMNARIFSASPMELKDSLLTLKLEDRLFYDRKENIFFVNFEGLQITDRNDIQNIEKMVGKMLQPLGKKVPAIVNYDNFDIASHLLDEYSLMVKQLSNQFYTEVTRYTTSTFMRMQLGNALQNRHVAPHIYENNNDARKALKTM